MVKFIFYCIILVILLKVLSNAFIKLADAIEKKRTEKHREELRLQEIKEQEELIEALRQQETIRYTSLWQYANNLRGSCFYFTAIVIQKLAENIYHVIMYPIENQWHRIIEISIVGTPREPLKKGNIILFRGEVLGYCKCVIGIEADTTYPWLKVYAESIIVKGYADL